MFEDVCRLTRFFCPHMMCSISARIHLLLFEKQPPTKPFHIAPTAGLLCSLLCLRFINFCTVFGGEDREKWPSGLNGMHLGPGH